MKSDLKPELIATTYHSKIEKIRHGETVAVRKTSNQRTEKTIRQWENEMKIMKLVAESAGHLAGNISRLLESDAEELSLTMPFENGRSLDLFVSEKMFCTLESQEAQSVWLQMSRAIDFLHSNAILHDDVKPDNIIWISAEQRAVLIDFGAASIVKPGEPVLFHPSGTPPYVPPEFLTRRRGFEGDIWGLGITILFVKGYVPLSDGEWILPHVFEQEQPRKEMEAWLAGIETWRVRLQDEDPTLARMLEAHPDRRITAGSLLADLRQHAQG